MAEILFYHLTESSMEDALPALLERTLARGWRAVVQTASEERRDALDTHLWSYRDDSFLAHGSDRDSHAEHQPVILTTGPENPNGAAVRFLVEGAVPPDSASYERMVFLFDGHDSGQVDDARAQWKAQKTAGHEVAYWQQTPDRRWERKS